MRNRIHFEDCLEGAKRIPAGSVDAVFTDLPYGTTKNRWDTLINLQSFWVETDRILKPNGVVILTAQAPFDKCLAVSNLKDFRYEWIWEKTAATGHLNAKKMPMKAHENVLIFYKKPPTYNPQKTTGHVRKVSTAEHKRNSKKTTNYGDFENTGYDSTERYPRSVLKFPSDKQKSSLNATQKPLALGEYFVKTYTNPGDTVVDFCTGSGTFPLACHNTGRNWIAFENDPLELMKANYRLFKHGA